MNFAAERFVVPIATEKNRLDGLAPLGQRSIGRVGGVSLGKAPQEGFRVRGPEPQRGRLLDPLVVLLANQIPAERAGQDGFQVRLARRGVGCGKVKLLPGDGFQSRQPFKSQKVTEGESDLTLAVAVDLRAFDGHLRAMPEYALHHGGDFGGRTTPELGVDTGRIGSHMPVDHDAAPAVAGVPSGHQVLIIGPELFGIGGPGGRGV